MKNIIVGTAGHIDHGKTTLVKALTGIDTDRLKEEKERGISIDLGFANLKLAGGVQIAFVDVPGHERFVRNMMAGASGIDLVLLVVAADEAIKPQTREHFEICRLLGVRDGIVVLTKADLVEEDWLALVRMEVEDLVAGSFLEKVPILPVSAISGAGLPELIAAILSCAQVVKGREAGRMARLPIDRAFVMKGHGTVVTGTLRDGKLAVEDEVQLYPSQLVARVRGIQVHGEKVKEAVAGQRTAVNLAGVEVGDVERGFVAAAPTMLVPSRIFDAKIETLAGTRAIRDRARVQLHSGTAEVPAELRILSNPRQIAAGASGWVRVVLQRETLVLPGDRFILRSLSPAGTLGGGTVMELHPEGRRLKRLRRTGAVERLELWAGLDLQGRILKLTEESRVGLEIGELRRALGCVEADLPKELIRLGGWVVSALSLKAVAGEIVSRLREHHKAMPLEAGMSREALRGAVLAAAPPAMMEAALRYAPSVKVRGDLVHLESHKVKLAASEDKAMLVMEEAFRSAGLAVPGVDEVLRASGLDAATAKAMLAMLLRSGALVRVGQEMVFHSAAIDDLKQIMVGRKGQRFGVADFKDWTGVSRKYAIPLLEYLDCEKVTRRDGEQRQIL